jgi:RNA polymerase sigma-70 factor, ECF subfamily
MVGFIRIPFFTAAEPELDAVMKSHLPTMYRVARGLTGRVTDAEDLVHDACVKALSARGQLKNPDDADIKAWLNWVLLNRFRDSYRRMKRSPVTLQEHYAISEDESNVVEMVASTELTPMESIENRESSSAIEHALFLLPPEVRVVSVFFLINGLSYREIAEVTESPIGTVMSRLARGRKLLREALLGHYEGDEPSISVIGE